MKYSLCATLIIVLLFFTECRSKCGEDVSLGEFELISSSKEDWFPYFSIDELSFKNGSGEIITLHLSTHENRMDRLSIQQICNEGWTESAEEYINGEWVYSE